MSFGPPHFVASTTAQAKNDRNVDSPPLHFGRGEHHRPLPHSAILSLSSFIFFFGGFVSLSPSLSVVPCLSLTLCLCAKRVFPSGYHVPPICVYGDRRSPCTCTSRRALSPILLLTNPRFSKGHGVFPKPSCSRNGRSLILRLPIWCARNLRYAKEARACTVALEARFYSIFFYSFISFILVPLSYRCILRSLLFRV